MFFLSKCPGSNAISHQKHLELLLVSYLLIELFNIGMPVTRAEGRTTGRTVTWLPKFLGWKDYQIVLRMGLRSREELCVPCPYEVMGTSYVADSRSPSTTLETQEIWMHDWVPVKVEKNHGFSSELFRILRNRVQIFFYLKHLLRVNKRSNIPKAKKNFFYRFKYSNIQVKGIVMVLRHEFYYLF